MNKINYASIIISCINKYEHKHSHSRRFKHKVLTTTINETHKCTNNCSHQTHVNHESS